VTRFLYDAGAFIALDRNDRASWRRLANANADGAAMVTHAGIIAQVWRNPARQARLAQVTKGFDVRPLTFALAKTAGELLAATKTTDVHDATLALLCQAGDTLLTSDVGDLSKLLSELDVQNVALLRV
jgi:hypothetical protein